MVVIGLNSWLRWRLLLLLLLLERLQVVVVADGPLVGLDGGRGTVARVGGVGILAVEGQLMLPLGGGCCLKTHRGIHLQ